MCKMSRTKGAQFERDIVNFAKAAGLEARRTAPNQTQDGSDEFGDVRIAGKKIECKHLASASKFLWTGSGIRKAGDWYWQTIAGHDAIIIKRTAQPGEKAYEPLVIVPNHSWSGVARLVLTRDYCPPLAVITRAEYFMHLQVKK